MFKQLRMQERSILASIQLMEANIHTGSLKEQAQRLSRLEKARAELDDVQHRMSAEIYLDSVSDKEIRSAVFALSGLSEH